MKNPNQTNLEETNSIFRRNFDVSDAIEVGLTRNKGLCI
jgi:hypothetical protein